jgi:hypothetical protein
MAGLASGTGNKAAPLNERKDDLYESPPEAVTALLRAEKLPSVIWDSPTPSGGYGSISLP